MMSLAEYASSMLPSRGRLMPEKEDPSRSAFQRDRDRIVHAEAFRRLKHKTQVFVAHTGDYYRTRLTHSLEVAQIARSMARTLRLDEDLAECLALAHDLGHTPFGHAGEVALNQAMQPHGGFDHNGQSLRIVTQLEERYFDFDGLNLSWETLEGLVKHNGPLTMPFCYAIEQYSDHMALELDSWPGLEAQIAAISDDIAYNNHDIDDGLQAGLISLDQLAELPLTCDILHNLREHHADAARGRMRHELIRRMIAAMIADITRETQRRLKVAAPKSVADVRACGRALVGFSGEMEANHQKIKNFLHGHVYQHHSVNRSMNKAQRVVRELFDLFECTTALLPEEWQDKIEREAGGAPRVICDYIAGMTDRFAIAEHRRLFEINDDRA